MADLVAFAVSPAPGWWLLHRPAGDGGPWFRDPLAAWTVDAEGAVRPMVVARGGLEVVPVPADIAPPARLLHSTWLGDCACTMPDPGVLDRAFCRYCASIIDRDQR